MARTLKQHLDPAEGPKRILSLDGGGVKGILTLGMLEAVEAELRRRSGDPKLVLSDYYDLIGGTSTGAIISSGLALGKSVEEMIGHYMTLGPLVFGRRLARGWFKAQYDARILRKALNPILGAKRTLGSSDLRTGFALCAKRVDSGSAWVLSNNPAAKFYDGPSDATFLPNRKYFLVDVVMASAAAPTYFDDVRIPIERPDPEFPNVKPDDGYFMDGAVTGNNNPSQQLLMLALLPEYGFGWRGGDDALMMTSVGTGQRRPRIKPQDFVKKSTAERGIHALSSMIFDTQMQALAFMQSVSDPKKPWYVNSEVEFMTAKTITPGNLLDFQRIDARLEPRKGEYDARKPMAFAEDLLGQSLSDAELTELDKLDNMKGMDTLLTIGRAAGKQFVSETYPDPKFDLPEWKAAS